MKTDSIFYRIFQTFPQSFFDLLNLLPETVNFYQFSSRFFSEIFLYLHQSEVSNNWQGVIIYPHPDIENSPQSRYQEFFDSGRVNRFYLNQLNKIESIGVNVLKLIVEPENKAIQQGKELIQQVRNQFEETLQQQAILELIETILIYKLPKLNHKEIEKMFSLSDLRETKVYQEALEEGIEQGIERGRMEEKLEAIPRLLALGLNIEQIAQALELSLETVQENTKGRV